MNTLKLVSTIALAAGLHLTGVFAQDAPAKAPASSSELDAKSFASIHRQIGPQSGESLWRELPWLTDLHDARLKAAAEGKPLFLMVSGKGLSIGMC